MSSTWQIQSREMKEESLDDGDELVRIRQVLVKRTVTYTRPVAVAIDRSGYTGGIFSSFNGFFFKILLGIIFLSWMTIFFPLFNTL